MPNEIHHTIQLLPMRAAHDQITDVITAATRSVHALIYMSTYPKSENIGPADKIQHALVNAANRGLDVRAIFSNHERASSLDRDNRALAARLAAAGAHVRFTAPNTLQHAKLIIVDEFIVFQMSSNLTSAAFTKNIELNTVAIGPTFAHQCADRFRTIWRDHCGQNLQATPA